MAFAVDYRFSIMLGNYYLYVNTGTGVVTPTLTPTYLQYAPSNWQDISITFERGWTYYGLFRQFTSSFNFVKDGAKIIRWAAYLSVGVETPIVLKIEKYNRLAAVADYEDFLQCDIDVSTMQDSLDEVSVNLIEGGFIGKLKARENTTYEIDVINHPDVIWVKMHGIKLNCDMQWIVSGNEATAFTDIVLPNTSYYQTLGVNTKLQPRTVNPVLFQSTFVANTSGTGPQDIDILSKFSFIATMGPGNTADGEVRVVLQLTQIDPLAFVSNIIISTTGPLPPGSSTTISLDQIDTMTLPDNHQLELHIICDDGLGGGGSNDYDIDILNLPGGISVSFNSTVPEGYIPALRPKTVADEIVDKVSDGDTDAFSDMLEVEQSDKVITSGDALRLLENSKLKITPASFYKSINSAFSSGLHYDKDAELAYFENKSFYFDSSTVITMLSGVSNLTVKPLISEMASKLKAGFRNITYDEINGKDEFNQETEFLLPYIRITNEKDLTSDIRADMYGIEYTRLNLTDKKSTDADSDNDPFFIHIDSAPAGTIPAGYLGEGEDYYEIYRTPIDATPGPSHWEISNLMYPETAFNIFFSAKRQLQRWGNYLASILYLLDGQTIKFQTKTKTNEDAVAMSTSEGAGPTVIDEGADESVGNYTDPLFLPYLFEFDYADNANLRALVEANPHGVIRFPYKGNTLEGFVIKMVTQPVLKKQTCTLLATPNNDLNDLVYFG